MILYVGDLHGSVAATVNLDALAIELGATAVVQVGDMGLRWQPDALGRFFDKRGRQAKKLNARRKMIRWYTAGGNHENWARWKAAEIKTEGPLVELAPEVFYVKRGSLIVINGLRHAFCGGAESSDKHLRTPGKTWWPEETPSRAEFELFFDSVDAGVDVVVTHDAPKETGTFRHADRGDRPTCQTLSRVIELSSKRPGIWAFGHHHNHERVDVSDVRGITTYLGCGLEGQGWLLDGSRLEKIESVKVELIGKAETKKPGMKHHELQARP